MDKQIEIYDIYFKEAVKTHYRPEDAYYAAQIAANNAFPTSSATLPIKDLEELEKRLELKQNLNPNTFWDKLINLFTNK